MPIVGRRQVLAAAAGFAGIASAGKYLTVGALAGDAPQLDPALPQGLQDTARLEALPGKIPLIKLSYRPPNFETPIDHFTDVFTPNEAFFVRYHLAFIPEVDAAKWRLRVGGDAASNSFELTLDDLKAFEPHEIAAVCQCSGNRRGLFDPHVQGVEWGYGAMGNARWKGARLKDILAKANLKDGAKEIVLDGADGPVLDKTPDFIKSIPVSKAMENDVIVAYEMNGKPLPHWNGYPARVVVPGWTATYWMKHVVSINVVSQPFDGFWMKTAYRIPNGTFPVVAHFPTQETTANTPITEMVVNSLITSPRDGSRLGAGTEVAVTGVAWDSGFGITRVQVSTDDGKSFEEATLGEDHGRFSFRPWRYSFRPKSSGPVTILACASNRIGQTQTTQIIPNPAGYHHNVMHRVTALVG